MLGIVIFVHELGISPAKKNGITVIGLLLNGAKSTSLLEVIQIFLKPS